MKKIYFTAALVVYSMYSFAQKGYEDYADEEEIIDFEKYAQLDLSKVEIISIVIGIILLLVTKKMIDKDSKSQIGVGLIGCIGVLCAFPLILVILAVAKKAIEYTIILAVVIGGLYLLFSQKEW